MKKKFVFFLIFCVLFTTLALAEVSDTVIKRKDLGFDEALTPKTEINYSRPKQILVTHIVPEHEDVLRDFKSWLQFFHYYSMTRLRLPDIPFNYIVDSEGNIYEGLENSENRTPFLDAGDGIVLIAYISTDSSMSNQAKEAFKNLVEKYSYKFAIQEEDIDVVEVFLEEPAGDSLPLLSYKPTDTAFKKELLEIVKKFKFSEEANIRFSGSVDELKYENVVKSGDSLSVKFSLKNEDTFPWFVDSNEIFLSTADGEESIFAANQIWDSFSKPFALKKQIILPGESVDLSLKLDTEGIVPGDYEAEFKFVMLPDIDVKGTEFKVKFKIDKGDRKVVQIKRTGTGALTVYECPRYNCAMVAAAKSGERYLVVDEEELWYKIVVEGVEGWVTIHYADLVD